MVNIPLFIGFQHVSTILLVVYRISSSIHSSIRGEKGSHPSNSHHFPGESPIIQYIIFSQYIHYMFTIYNKNYIICIYIYALYIYDTHTYIYILYVHTIIYIYTHTIYIHYIHTIYIYTQYIHTIYIYYIYILNKYTYIYIYKYTLYKNTHDNRYIYIYVHILIQYGTSIPSVSVEPKRPTRTCEVVMVLSACAANRSWGGH